MVAHLQMATPAEVAGVVVEAILSDAPAAA
jgi:hypothetical protein